MLLGACLCMYMYLYIHVYVRMHACIYVCNCVYIYIYPDAQANMLLGAYNYSKADRFLLRSQLDCIYGDRQARGGML